MWGQPPSAETLNHEGHEGSRSRERQGLPSCTFLSFVVQGLILQLEGEDSITDYLREPCSCPPSCSSNAAQHSYSDCARRRPIHRSFHRSFSRSACRRRGPPWSRCESARGRARLDPPAW